MVPLDPENVLLIGDTDGQVKAALSAAVPNTRITSVATYFDGIAELRADHYSAVLAAAEPIERRPEPAVKTLRELAAESRLVLFGHPTLEPLSRKMLDFGCDDYVITPVGPGELHQLFSAPLLRVLAPAPAAVSASHEEATAAPAPAAEHALLAGLPLAEVVLDALNQDPQTAAGGTIDRLNELIRPALQVSFRPAGAAKREAPAAPEGQVTLAHPVRSGGADVGDLDLVLPRDEDADAARHFLARLADLLGKIYALEERHKRLQQLAITDELTGLCNARYFRHFLSRIIELAQVRRFPVTLFIFDIDNFKRYNDQFGHSVGDRILQETASLMRRCCREHDLVARIGGDEFAVVFWENEGPRKPKEPKPAGTSREPKTALDILERFRRLLARRELHSLGSGGQGVLTISGGLAVYPYDARDVKQLIEAADHQLVFKAKKAGKNKIFLVGSGEQVLTGEEPK